MRKRILAGVLCMLVLLTTVGGISVSSEAGDRFSGGSGSADDPYLLADIADLNTLAEATKTETFRKKYFKLVSDVEEAFGGGIGKDRDHPFSGKFDGNGHTVRLEIADGGQYAGMFGYLVGSEIRSLCVDGYADGSNYVGGVCGRAEDSIFEKCVCLAAVRGNNAVGGLCGSMEGGSALKCESRAAVTAEGSKAGGICGEMQGSCAKSCASFGKVTASENAGGICGMLSGGAEIRNCVSRIALQAGDSFGGIVGKAEGGKVQNCFSKVENANAVGGICSGTVFADCYYEENGNAAFGSLGTDCKAQTVEEIGKSDYGIRSPAALLNDGKESDDTAWTGDRDGIPVLMMAQNEYAVSLCGDFNLIFYLDLAWYVEELGLSTEEIVVEAGFVQNEETYNPNLTEMTYTAETMTVGSDGKYRAVFPITATEGDAGRGIRDGRGKKRAKEVLCDGGRFGQKLLRQNDRRQNGARSFENALQNDPQLRGGGDGKFGG